MNSPTDTARDTILAELNRLLDDHPDGLPDDAKTRYDELIVDLEKANDLAKRRQDLLEQIASGNVRLEPGESQGPYFHVQQDPFETPAKPETAQDTRSRALTVVERWKADDELKQSATDTLERLHDGTGDSTDVRGVSSHLIRYSQPLYVSAFRKYARDPESYVADLTPEERAVWADAREHQRTVLATSGAVLPSPLDPTIVLTNNGAIDPMRQLARVETTMSKSKRFITSAGSTFSFEAENVEVSDDTFTEAEVEITTHKAQGFIQATIETWMDQPGFSSEVAKIIADGKQRLEAGKFITGAGDGSNEPFGIETELSGGSSEVNAAGEALVADDVYGLLEALPARFRQNARWQLELSTLNFIHRLWNPSGSEPRIVEDGQIANVPYMLNSSIDPYSAVDAGATATNRVLFVGDWSKYVILDRVGLSVNFIPPGHLLNTTGNLPDGRVGWYAYWRVGAESIVDGAFRMLDVQTAA